MSTSFQIRPANRADVSALFALIQALAAYEKLSDAVVGSAASLEDHLFGDRPCIEAIVADDQGQAIGFALFFTVYHTFPTQPGIYLEDLFVLPEYRGQSVGKALLRQLAEIVVERQWQGLDWAVLDWNEPAIGFYKRIGAAVLEDVRVCRVAGSGLARLAADQVPLLRSAVVDDIPALFALAAANADFHRSLPQFVGTADALADHLFGVHRYAEAVVGEQEGKVVAFALFLTNYSTFLTKPGLYIEDLFVDAAYRRRGLGRAMLTDLARKAVVRGCGRLEWLVATWNESAIDFYRSMGAVVLDDWRICKLRGSGLENLAQGNFAGKS